MDYQLLKSEVEQKTAQTIEVLKREIENDSIIYGIRDIDSILNTANNFTFDQLASLNLFNDKLAESIGNKIMERIEDLEGITLLPVSTVTGSNVIQIKLKHPISTILTTMK